ncbi:hypothetical protein ACS0TY_034950 [Phlomoides rotata]
MGCASSKLAAEEIKDEKKRVGNGDYIHHVVSLTSSTYGLLKLDKEGVVDEKKQTSKELTVQVQKPKSPSTPSPSREEASHEVINAWELMEDLEDEVSAIFQSKRWRAKSPFKLLGSPRKGGGGKENKGRVVNGLSLENSPKRVLKDCTNLKKPSPKLWASIKGSPIGKRCESLRVDSSRRRSLGPLFDPKKDEEVSEEEKKKGDAILESYKKKCPPGGENAVIIYTTTLRGIRKTFEECNVARSTIESQNVQMYERDISMHSAFKEELRAVMKSKEVRVPAVFVKGRFIGGAEEVVKLDEEGILGILLSGIPKAAAGVCSGCGGVRFVMCVECSGSCKVLGEEDGKKKSLKCNKCNENGLIQCPFCCFLTI